VVLGAGADRVTLDDGDPAEMVGQDARGQQAGVPAPDDHRMVPSGSPGSWSADAGHAALPFLSAAMGGVQAEVRLSS
jgi:hypothetical protein